MPRKQIENFLKIIEEEYNKKVEYDVILVTGTAGKTTTCHYTNLILQKLTNLKIGLFSKPHITNITERIRINYTPIPQDKFEYYSTFIKNLNQRHNLDLGWFDELVAIAILYFIDENVELAIFEIGIGGLNDSTNALKSKINVITNISLEHTDILGKTIQEIAQQKAGIIKDKSIVITNTSRGLKIIKHKSQETQSKLYILKEFIKKTKLSSNFPYYTYEIKMNKNQYICKFNSYYLVDNFCLAFLTSKIYLDQLRLQNGRTKIKHLSSLNSTIIQQIIDSMDVPLKTQLFHCKNKKIIIDTAKDFSSLMKLFRHLLTELKDFDVILSFSKGKEVKLIKKILLFLTTKNIRIYLTEHSIQQKKADVIELLQKVYNISSEPEKKTIEQNVKIIPPIQTKEELYKIIEMMEKSNIVITGSLYFVSDIYNKLQESYSAGRR